MAESKHKVFISYHHFNDQYYKNELEAQNEIHDIFINKSVALGDIDENDDQKIRTIIRDDYLQDSSVTILLVGTETKNRKHIDWELYSSMINGSKNKKSGLLIIQLPSISPRYITASNLNEKSQIHSNINSWMSIGSKVEYERRYPFLPKRIIDNLLKTKVKISVVKWEDIHNKPENLKLLIDNAYNSKANNEYCLKEPMRMKNS